MTTEPAGRDDLAGLLEAGEAFEKMARSEPFRLGSYATGNYQCRCFRCKKLFGGDKRAIECLLCAVETYAKAAHAAIIKLEQENAKLRGVGNEILTIADEYKRQEESGYVYSPGGLEHMGDVWRKISRWAEALRADGEEGYQTMTEEELIEGLKKL